MLHAKLIIIGFSVLVNEKKMIHAKFKDHRTSGSGEEDSIYGHGSHLGHVTCAIYINFRSPFSRKIHIKFG